MDLTMKDVLMVVHQKEVAEIVNVIAHLGIPDFTARLDLNVLLLISLAEMALRLRDRLETVDVCVLNVILVHLVNSF